MARSSSLMLGVAAPVLIAAVFALPQLNVVGAASVLVGSNAAHAETASVMAKSDRLQPPRPSTSIASPATVEVVGLGPTAVILRDRMGNVLYRADLPTNTTSVARDVDLPVITVKERVESPVASKPAPSLGAGSGESRTIKTGCEGFVSSLVAHEVRRIPGRCMT